jgi:two-component system sensor histidine kinase CpxA
MKRSSRARFPLMAKMLVWLLVHLIVLGGGFALFVAWELRLGLDSLLSGTAGDRLKNFGESVAIELRASPENDWPRLLHERGASAGLQLSLRGESMPIPIGDLTPIPGNVSDRLEETRRNGPGPAGRRPPPGRGNRPPPGPSQGPPDDGPPEDGAPDDGPPEDRQEGRPQGRPSGHILDGLTAEDLAAEDHTRPDGRPAPARERPIAKPFFLLRGDHGDGYWAAMDLPVFEAGLTAPRHLLLLVRSETASAHGLFFDLSPWIQGGVAVFILSLILWAPFFLGITRYLTRLSRATEAIAGGKFDTRIGVSRSDELGILGDSIETMAARLDRLVTGQKRFLADVAHELCSPLARIRTGFGVLENSVEDAHHERIESIDEDIEELSRLVSEVLAFTKASTAPGAVRTETVELLPIVTRALTRECPGQSFDLRVPEDTLVIADRSLLDRAIANVLRNAHRHAGSESHLVITAHPVDRFIQLTLADNGPGVSQLDLPRLFEPFYRPDAARTREAGGTGLGLAIVRSALEAFGGTVRAESAAPHGLAIVLLIPAAP